MCVATALARVCVCMYVPRVRSWGASAHGSVCLGYHRARVLRWCVCHVSQGTAGYIAAFVNAIQIHILNFICTPIIRDTT